MEAVKVFGYGIKYLKDHLFGRVKRTLPETRDDDIRYVLTVPAIWNEGAKLFMREAAKVVSFMRSSKSCKFHVNFEYRILPKYWYSLTRLNKLWFIHIYFTK